MQRHIKAKARPQHRGRAGRQPLTRARLCTVNVTSGIMTRTSRPERTGRTLKSSLPRLTAPCALGHDSTVVCCQHARNCRVQIVVFSFSFFCRLPKYNIFHTHGQGAQDHMWHCGAVKGGLGDCDCRPGVCRMISLAPLAISQRLQTLDKLLVSVRGNGIQRPNEALSVFRSLSQISPKENYNRPVVAASRCWFPFFLF